MRRRLNIFNVVLGIFVLFGLLVKPVSAEELIGEGPPAASNHGIVEQDGIVTPDDFGLDWIQLNIGSMGFTPLSNGEWIHFSNGWANRSGGTNSATCISPRFPNGVALYGLTVWLDDTSGTNNISVDLNTVDLDTNTNVNLFSYTTSGTPGIFRAYIGLASVHTVNADRQTYWACIYSGVTNSSLRHSGLTFWYKRQVSPAPGSATFGDVGTGHPFFQWVEALYDSGITAGCGGGNYCPDDYVTRGQMAVFIAAALGL